MLRDIFSDTDGHELLFKIKSLLRKISRETSEIFPVSRYKFISAGVQKAVSSKVGANHRSDHRSLAFQSLAREV